MLNMLPVHECNMYVCRMYVYVCAFALWFFIPWKQKKFAGVCHRNKQQLCALFSGLFVVVHNFLLFVLNTFFMGPALTWA